jgi:hypothetical protein
MIGWLPGDWKYRPLSAFAATILHLASATLQ